MATTPTISIVMPLYNKGKWVSKTVSSILSQTFREFELIIVDDGSTDDSLERVKSFKDGRVKIFSQKNSGVSIARNRGISEAKGKFIAFIDADDIWLDRHLEYLIEGFNRYPDIILSANPIALYRGELNSIDIPQPSEVRYRYYNYIDSLYCNQFPIHIGSILVERSVVDRVGGFCEDMRIGEDVNWILRVSCEGKAIISNYKGMIYHLVDGDGAMLSSRGVEYIPQYLRELNIERCSILERLKLKKFIFTEYLKKAYQNRVYPLDIRELYSRNLSDSYRLGAWSIIFYLIVRYMPESIYKKIKNR